MIFYKACNFKRNSDMKQWSANLLFDQIQFQECFNRKNNIINQSSLLHDPESYINKEESSKNRQGEKRKEKQIDIHKNKDCYIVKFYVLQGELIVQYIVFMNTPNISLLFQNSLSSLQNISFEALKGIHRTSVADKNNDSQSFQPQYHQIKKLGLKINKKKICTGGWSSQQNQVYLQFMIENVQDFLTQKARRKNKVFYRLSKIIKKRTPDQCRSHHQKLQLKYRDDLYSIMNEVQKKIQRCMAEEYVNQQQRQHFKNFEFFKLQFKPNRPTQEYEPLVKGGWFDIKTQGPSLKITIDTNVINNW